MRPEPRTITGQPDLKRSMDVVRQFFDDPPAVVQVLVGAESLSVRRITLRVTDRIGRTWANRWLVGFYLTTAAGGDPSATGNTFAVVAPAYLWQTVTANAAVYVLTDADGTADIDVTIAVPATRVAYAFVVGRPEPSDSITWT